MWALDEDWDGSTDATRSLMLSLARPAITAEEVTWKKGKENTDVLLLILQARFVLFALRHSNAKCIVACVLMLARPVDEVLVASIRQ